MEIVVSKTPRWLHRRDVVGDAVVLNLDNM